ncbi:hypothetical protein Tco_0577687, partial [Tanacetum coccineum]
MHKFYKEESTLSIPIDDGSIRSVTTIKITKASSLTIPRDTVEVFQKTDRKSSAPPKNADVLLRLEKDITIEASHEVLEKEKSRKSSSTDEIIDTEKGQGEKKSPPDSQDEVEQKKSYATIDGYRYAFMQFNSQKAAQLAVE